MSKNIQAPTERVEDVELTKHEKKILKEKLKREKELVKAEKKIAKEASKKTEKKQKKEFEEWLAQKELAAQEEAKRPRRLFETKKEPRKALATFFRNQNKLMVSSMAIADRKAMIMIRINSLIVSVAMISFRFLDDSIHLGWLLGLILIIGTGGALVFAILAARPNNRFLMKIGEKEIFPSYPNLEERNFWVPEDASLQEYEQSMDKVVNSQELQIGNQVRFAYMIEKYLSAKYRLLDIAYNLFLGSLILTAIVFLADRIFHVV